MSDVVLGAEAKANDEAKQEHSGLKGAAKWVQRGRSVTNLNRFVKEASDLAASRRDSMSDAPAADEEDPMRGSLTRYTSKDGSALIATLPQTEDRSSRNSRKSRGSKSNEPNQL